MQRRTPHRAGRGWTSSALLVMSLCLPTAVGCASASRYAPRSAPSSVASYGGVAVASVAESVTTASTGEEDSSESRSDGDAPAPPAAPEPGVQAQATTPPASVPPPAPPPPAGPAQAALGNTVAHGPAGRNQPGTTPPAQPSTPATQPAAEAQAPAPMLIYTAAVDLSVRRAEVTQTLDRVVDLAYAMGGYLVRRTDAQVQVRVPSARFREGVRRVEELADVLHRSIEAQDVSEEFNDLEVRLTNLRAVRQRLQEFLARSANVAEALRVEQEMERVTQEIDRIEGRMRFLRARATFSLVTVTAHPRAEAVVAPDPQSGPAVRRPLDLPVGWLDALGLGRLLQIR